MVIHHITKATKHLIVSLLIVSAIGLSVIRVFMLGIEDYKVELENRIAELTTLPVKIGKLRANMRGINPEIILKDIHIIGADTQSNDNSPIKLNELRLGVDLIQLLRTQQLLPSTWLTLVGVKLDVVRKKDGTLLIKGLNSVDSEQPTWLLKGNRYEVFRSQISWTDELRKTPTVHFDNVDLLINNDRIAETHTLHLLSHLPEYYGKDLRLSLVLHGDVLNMADVDARFYLQGNEIKLSRLPLNEFPINIKVDSGEADFKIWGQWKSSTLLDLSSQLQLKDLAMQAPGKDGLEISHLQTEFKVQSLVDGWQVNVKELQLKTERYESLPGQFSFAADSAFTHIAASVGQLDIQPLSELIQFFAPLSKETNTLISQLAVSGIFKDLAFYLNLEHNSFAVNGVFDNLSVNAYGGMPKLNHLTGYVKGTDESGAIKMDSKNIQLALPDVLRESLLLTKLQGRLSWLDALENLQLKTEALVLESEDIKTKMNLAITSSKNAGPVFMDMQMEIAEMKEISRLAKYLPFGLMGKDISEWLDAAFVSGQIKRGDVLLYGNLEDFPYNEGQGVFQALLNLDNIELQYSSEWPHLKKMRADVDFIRDSLAVNILQAESEELMIKQALVTVASFDNSDYLLVQNGEIEGSVMAAMNLLQASPLRQSARNVLDVITPAGLTSVALDLEIPLVDGFHEIVKGVARLDDAAFNVQSVDLNVTDIVGNLEFTEQGLSSKGIAAKALGAAIAVKLDSYPDNTLIRVDGRVSIAQLQKQFSALDSEFVTKKIKGSTAYELAIKLPVQAKKPAQLNLVSNLMGIKVELPEILTKESLSKKPFKLQLDLKEKGLLPMTLNYDDQLKAALKLNPKTGAIQSADIVYGFGDTRFVSKKGINLTVNKNTFNPSLWMDVIQGGVSKQGQSEYAINRLSVTTEELLWDDKGYGHFKLDLRKADNAWQGNVSSILAKGAFVVPFKESESDKIKLDMETLNLSGLMQLDFQSDSYGFDDVPFITVSSQQLAWGDVNLGALEIETEKLADGIRFNRVNVLSNEHRIEMQADWLRNNGDSITSIRGSFVADDLGKFLQKLNFSNDLKEVSAKIDVLGYWTGAPYQFSLENLEADLDLSLNDGRISSIEPGFGRVLGLIAMEQWMKRLTLDFGDIYKKGLSLNSITGHFKIVNGKATTKNLLVDSIPALITIIGDVDLLNKTLDQKVGVVPKSSGALPIAGTIVSSIAKTITQAFTNDYKAGFFFGSKYKINGRWDDVQVTPLHEQDGFFMKTWTGITDFSWAK